MYSRNDPRLRRTLNQISHNLESANESAQVGLFSVNEHYIKPCLSSVTGCFNDCVGDFFPSQDERTRRARMRGRSRAEMSFDFYDDWEEDENAALLSWGNEEYEREEDGAQPKRRNLMDYGSRTDRMTPPARRRTLGERTDPTIIPSQSYFGFLQNLPFKVGRRALRYKPSAEGLQDRFKGKTRAEPVPAITEGDEDDLSEAGKARHGRIRSNTVGSGHTTDSLSSRGDIFPSDDEDAVPLDDEFYLADNRTGSTPDDMSSGKRSSRPGNSRRTSRTTSSQSMARPQKVGKSSSGRRGSNRSSAASSLAAAHEPEVIPKQTDFKLEEERLEAEEEDRIRKRRDAAQTLARVRGLGTVPPRLSPQAPTTPASMLAMPNSASDAA